VPRPVGTPWEFGYNGAMMPERTAAQRPESVEPLVQGGVVPIVRLPDLDLPTASRLAQALLSAGLTALEFTMTTPGVLSVISRLPQEIPAFRRGDALLGVGSVVDPRQAAAALQAGAQFIVAPIFHPATVDFCTAAGVPVIPGAFTPTEIQTAWQHGVPLVKVFPARTLGPQYLRDLRAPLPHLRLMPTGGIDLDNVGAYIRAGAAAVGVGSRLVRADWIQTGSWDRLTELARSYVERIQEARSSA